MVIGLGLGGAAVEAVAAGFACPRGDHPAFGRTQYVGIPVRLSETPGSIRAPAPEHGQHTELLLTELLGYGWDEVSGLRERGVI